MQLRVGVAEVVDGPAEATSYVWSGFGAGAGAGAKTEGNGEAPAVTVAIAKQAGTNAVAVAREVLRKVDSMKGVTVPSDVHVTVI